MTRTPAQMREIAREFLAELKQQDPRCTLLIMMLSQVASLPANECLRRIEELANGN